MNIIRMTGGLGNQMFGYALYLRLVSMGRQVKMDDITEYENHDNARPHMLWCFDLAYPRAEREEIYALTDGFRRLPDRIRRKLFGRKSTEYMEKDCNFDPEVLERDNAYLTGYFQSERYFAPIEDQVREAFSFRDTIFEGLDLGEAERIRALAEEMQQGNSVSIHMRRGDYLDCAEVFGGNCSDAYYRSAVERMRKELRDRGPVTFYLFSNDAAYAGDWLDRYYPEDDSFVLVAGRPEEKGYLDLYLMSRCKAHIIANSSFSWWGSYLADSYLTIAPAVWFNDRDCRDIYRKDMIKMDAEGRIEGIEEPLISVIVAAYNIEKYIERCLESLLDQKDVTLEVIVVDDGSADRTGEICDAYARNYPAVQVIHKENGGLSSARNAGMEAAKGEYIGFVDGDDYIESEMYGALLRACKRNRADIAICTYRQIGERAENTTPTGRIIPMTREEALEIYISGHEQYHIYHSVWSKLFKREVLKGISFREGKKSEDIMYTTMALTAARSVVFVDIPLYNYVMNREGSIMNSGLAERRFGDEIPFLLEQADYLAAKGYPLLARKAGYQFYRNMLFYYIDFRNRKMKEAAGRMAGFLRERSGEIEALYGEAFVKRGDRYRMKLFLINPGAYYGIDRLYERIIIPLRARLLP